MNIKTLIGMSSYFLSTLPKCVVFIVQEYFSCIVKSFSKGIKCG